MIMTDGENESHSIYAMVNIYLMTCSAFISHYKNSYLDMMSRIHAGVLSIDGHYIFKE